MRRLLLWLSAAAAFPACDGRLSGHESALTLEGPASVDVGAEALLRVRVGAGLGGHLEIVDHQLGQSVLIASPVQTGEEHVARWRPPPDGLGAYALRAKLLQPDGRVVWSAPRALVVRGFEPFAAKPRAAPKNLVAVGGDGKVSLSWSATAVADGYFVYRGTAPGVAPSPANRVATAPGPSHLDATAVNGTLYYYVVTSYQLSRRTGAVVESAPSAEVSARPGPLPDTQPPSVSITSPAADQLYSAPQTVTIAIGASDNVGVTRVELYDGAQLEATLTAPPYLFAWSFAAADNGTHVFTAKAFDGAGNSSTSAARSLTIQIAAGDSTPPAVSITTPAADATYTAAQTVNLVASASDDVGVTKVEFYDGPTLVASLGTPPFAHAWSFTSADNGPHAWQAKAYDAAGNSAASPVRQLTVAIPVPPPAPAGLVATAQDGQNSVSWSAVSGATAYNLYWATTPGVTRTNGTKVVGATSPHLHGGLVNGVTYYYVVTAVNAAGESSESAEASATPVASSDSAPPSFGGLAAATVVGSTQVQLSWNAATDDQTAQSGIVYLVYQSSGAAIDYSQPVATSAAGATSFTVTGLAPATGYSFAVRARDGSGNEDANAVTKSATTLAAGTWPASWNSYEERVLTLVNERRAAGATCGSTYYAAKGALVAHLALRQAARLHSQDMADNNYFSHTSLDGRSPWTRMKDAGYTGTAMGENIAAGYSSPEAVVAGWMGSSGHCANIMSASFKTIGVGYAYNSSSTYRHYWTQDFGN